MKEESELTGDDARPRRGQARGQARARAMLSCPLCSSEFSILSNLEKHIDRDVYSSWIYFVYTQE